MGIIKNIKRVTDSSDILIDDIFFDRILMWKSLYGGYFAEWHDINYKTIAGRRDRRMATLGMPKVVANEMSSLIFNERCEINISDDVYSEEIKNVLNDNAFYSNFQRYLEYMFAMGGFVIKPYIGKGEKIKLSYITADCFLPTGWDNTRCNSGVFINSFVKGEYYYTHLEWHEWEGGTYIVRHELYESNMQNELGIPVALENMVGGDEIEAITYVENLDKPLFVYFKPNTANNFDTNIPLGIPLYANALDTLKSIDIAFDSLQREFKLGQKKIIVPTAAIKEVVDLQSGRTERYFDATSEVYEAFNMGQDGDQIKEITSVLRVDEHVAGLNALLNVLSMQIGFSQGAFSFDGQSVKTATEVVSEQSKTFKTKQSHEIIIETGLSDLIDIIGQLGDLYGKFTRPVDYEVTVTFDDSIAEDQSAEITKQMMMVSSGLTSKLKAIMKIHGYSEVEAQELLDQINSEQATVNAANVDMFGTTNTDIRVDEELV